MSKTGEKKISLQTVGCRLNQYETEKMAASLSPYGFRRVARGEAADLYIINTCTVTHRADSSSRYLISKAFRENPNGRIVVAGCYVDGDAETVSGLEGVDAVIYNQEKARIADILLKRFPNLFSQESDKGCSENVAAFDNYNRAWLKISDGCNQHCSFCILPRVRGQLVNRPVTEILDEINQLRRKGFEEVVLTGINIGYYRNRQVEPQVKSLAHLCRIILLETDMPRIRISSIEPQTVHDELLQVCADSGGRICRHFHLPLQSGSPRILRLMRRPYDRDIYLMRAAEARDSQPNTIIGADVIVGFPGETDEDFEQTKEVVQSGLIDYLHVFSYSDRAGTVASELDGKVQSEIIKERNAILTRISRGLRSGALSRQVGQVLEVIAEHSKPDRSDRFGISDNYIKVRLPHDYDGGRHIARIRITSAGRDFVDGHLMTIGSNRTF